MRRLDKQNIFVVTSLFVLVFFATFEFGSIAAYAGTSNSTNTTSVEQSNLDLTNTITSKGCGQGYGYFMDDPTPICEPVDKIGQGPPPDQAYCAALGCPYNPPTDSDLPRESDGSSNDNFATTPVTPTEKTAAEEAHEGEGEGETPNTDPDSANEDQNNGGGSGSNNDYEDGSDNSGSGEEGDSSDGDESEEG